VIPVHLFGNRVAALGLDLLAVDDAAQAIGADPAPRIGVLAALSAYPTKTWGAAGDAGFVAGDDEELLARVRRLGNHGAIEPGVHAREGAHAGRASRLDAVQAAVLLGHADVLEARIARRRSLADRYDAGLPAGLRPLPRQPGSPVQQYNVLSPERDRVKAALEARGIGTAVYYPVPLQRQPALAGCRSGPTPTADRLCATILALPIADCGPAEVDRVLEVLHRVAR
jgi:dTDP-4-amino-4,6-dideoxygalactose transaminase